MKWLATRGPSSPSADGQLTAIGHSGRRRTLRKGAKIPPRVATAPFERVRIGADSTKVTLTLLIVVRIHVGDPVHNLQVNLPGKVDRVRGR